MAPAIIIQWGYSQSSSKWSIWPLPPLVISPSPLAPQSEGLNQSAMPRNLSQWESLSVFALRRTAKVVRFRASAIVSTLFALRTGVRSFLSCSGVQGARGVPCCLGRRDRALRCSLRRHRERNGRDRRCCTELEAFDKLIWRTPASMDGVRALLTYMLDDVADLGHQFLEQAEGAS